MKLPPLNALRTFEAVARLESFALAADELNVTPSAVSHQIKSLETYLDVKLFHRQTRRIELTAEAERYLPAIQRAFDEIGVATRKLLNAGQGDLINLDVAPAFASGWLITRMHDFHRLHSGIQVRLSTSSTLVDFDRSDFDMAIRFGDGNWDGLRSHFLVAEHLVPLCSPKLLASDTRPQEPADLLDHPLLISLAKVGDWERWFSHVGVDFGEVVDGNWMEDTPLAIEAAVAGGGFAIANRLLVANELSDGRLVMPFDIPVDSGKGFYLVYPEERVGDRRVVMFREWVLGKVGEG